MKLCIAVVLILAQASLADWAKFVSSPAGVTGTYNGAGLKIQSNFTIQLDVSGDVYSIYSELQPNGFAPIWSAGRPFDGWGEMGQFSSFKDSNGLIELYPTDEVIDSHPMQALVGEPVRVTIFGPTSFEVQIGNPVADLNRDGVVSTQDIFDFVVCYLRNDTRADANSDGLVTSDDLFDFLASWFVAQ